MLSYDNGSFFPDRYSFHWLRRDYWFKRDYSARALLSVHFFVILLHFYSRIVRKI